VRIPAVVISYASDFIQLWAIMLRNLSELFVHQCAKNKFLDTLEDVLTSQRTSPVVREHLLDVLAAAVHASTGHHRHTMGTAPWELSHIVRCDTEQADVAALMSALLGTH
jgi:hypothetical protein